MSVEQNKRLRASLNGLIQSRLDSFKDQPLNRWTCTQIYVSIFEAINELMSMVPLLKQGLSEQAVNFTAQAYYDMIEVNGQELDPNVFTKRVATSELSNKELSLIGVLLADTPIIPEIVATLKKRA